MPLTKERVFMDVGYYLEIGLWFVWAMLLLVLTLWSSGRVRRRSRLRENPSLKRYESLVASCGLVVGVGMACMILLALLTLLTQH